MSAIRLVFGHVKRRLLGTLHSGQSPKHLPRHLYEYALRFNRRLAKSISHRFARLIEIAVESGATPYWVIVGRKMPNLKLVEG